MHVTEEFGAKMAALYESSQQPELADRVIE
jgi:hypothetical protein